MSQTDPLLSLLAIVLSACVGLACVDERAGADASVVAPSSVLPRYKLQKAPEDVERLPKALAEISGLAVTPDGRLFCHDDERGVIHELDVDRGKILKSFALGEGDVVGDFEGIAVADESVFLVTSDGMLYETREGPNGANVEYTVHESGIGDVCEVEGLDVDRSARLLWLACKTTRGSKLEGSVALFRWSIESRRLDEAGPVLIDKRVLREALAVDDFHPSGIAIHPAAGTLLIIAARERAIIEVTREGLFLGAAPLKRKRHAHPEGIAIGAGSVEDLDLIISDEGDDRRAQLARYRLRDSAATD